jgi:predicted dehydrogenase
VIKVHLTWNRNAVRGERSGLDIDPASVDWKRFLGNAPDQPFDPYRFRHWRWFWDFGGGIFTDLMVHYIDVAHWFLGLEEPSAAASIGNFFSREGDWETPDTVQTLLQYGNPETQVYFEGTFSNARNAAMMEFMGTDATLYCDRGRIEFHPEARASAPYYENVLGTGSRGQDFYANPNGEILHLSNWLECIRTRKEPNAPVRAGVFAAGAAHWANRALREERAVRNA